MDYIIRHAHIGDVPRMSYVYATSWRTAFRGTLSDEYLDNLADDHWVETFTKNFNGEHVPAPRGLVCAVDGVVIGALHYGHSQDERWPDDGEICSCYMLPEFWGQNLGHAMISKAMEHLRFDGYKTAYLWVLDNNLRAQKAYARLGFTSEGTCNPMHFAGRNITNIRYVVQL
ncbi:MAG: GNAT family N-acetyltransferase [Oscillospiraceae bacterium]|nr:GNAT family N-acetyltransferase [Oscillospiraceae bacterium]